MWHWSKAWLVKELNVPRHHLYPQVSYHHPNSHTDSRERLMCSQFYLLKSCRLAQDSFKFSQRILQVLLDQFSLSKGSHPAPLLCACGILWLRGHCWQFLSWHLHPDDCGWTGEWTGACSLALAESSGHMDKQLKIRELSAGIVLSTTEGWEIQLWHRKYPSLALLSITALCFQILMAKAKAKNISQKM